MTQKPPLSDVTLWAYVHNEAKPEEREYIDAHREDPTIGPRLQKMQELHAFLSEVAKTDDPYAPLVDGILQEMDAAAPEASAPPFTPPDEPNPPSSQAI